MRIKCVCERERELRLILTMLLLCAVVLLEGVEGTTVIVACSRKPNKRVVVVCCTESYRVSVLKSLCSSEPRRRLFT